jgi:hypothetical protein
MLDWDQTAELHYLEPGLNCGLRTYCELVTGGLTNNSELAINCGLVTVQVVAVSMYGKSPKVRCDIFTRRVQRGGVTHSLEVQPVGDRSDVLGLPAQSPVRN